MLAQIDPNDQNWECFINEDFSGIRSWDSHWDDQRNIPGYKPLWRCFAYELWMTGVTQYSADYPNHSAYQKSHAVFGADHTMKLIGEFKTEKNMKCDYDHGADTLYYPAPWHKYCHACDSPGNEVPNVHYYSGMIESTDSVGYGYYEIRCKMPVHPGTHDAFWFWGNYGHYEEIDVFEHGAEFCAGNIEKGFNAAIFYNAYGPSCAPDPATNDPGVQCYQLKHYLSPSTSLPLDEYHTYGCLWMPEKVLWYFDGIVFNEENDPSHIPQHPMRLKIIHYEDEDACQERSWWNGTDEMTIDYVKAFRLKADCDTDVVIRDLPSFNSFVPSVKHTITMGGINAPLVIPNSLDFTMRAVESITIDGSFEVPQGTEMTLIIQNCPTCSQEGVHPITFCDY